jgi:hypothetical protein
MFLRAKQFLWLRRRMGGIVPAGKPKRQFICTGSKPDVQQSRTNGRITSTSRNRLLNFPTCSNSLDFWAAKRQACPEVDQWVRNLYCAGIAALADCGRS